MNFQKLNGVSTPIYTSEQGCVIMHNYNRPFIPANDYNEINSLYASYHPSDIYTQTHYICINVTQNILINMMGTRYWDWIFVVTYSNTIKIRYQ